METSWISTMLSEFTASALLLIAGFFIGRYRERRRLRGRSLHQYDFYPYVATHENFAEFSLKGLPTGDALPTAQHRRPGGPTTDLYR